MAKWLLFCNPLSLLIFWKILNTSLCKENCERRRTYLLPVGPTRRGEEEVGEVRGGAEELGAVEVDDDALLLRVAIFGVIGVRVAIFLVSEHEVSHPHVSVADGVEARAEGVGGAPQLDQQLEHLVRNLAQLQHVLLDACKKGIKKQ